jgi:single-stranded DNA-binding protein
MSYNHSNNIQLIGRLGAEPKTYQGDNSAFTILSIAENRARFDKETGAWQVLEPHWFDVFCFSPLDKKAYQLKKGDEIKISGTLKPVKHLVDGKNISSIVVHAKKIWKLAALSEKDWMDQVPDFDSVDNSDLSAIKPSN